MSEDQAREEDEVGVGEVVMEFPVQCLAHQPQGLLKVVCNEKQVGSGRWHTLAIGLGPWRSRFVCCFISLWTSFQCIFVSAK